MFINQILSRKVTKLIKCIHENDSKPVDLILEMVLKIVNFTPAINNFTKFRFHI